MPKFPKAPPQLVRRFDAALARTPGERRVMFGYPAGFVNGNMFCGVFGAEVFVRLAPPERDELLAERGAHPLEVIPGRPSKHSVVLPAAVAGDDGALLRWLARAFDAGGALPPKVKKPAKRKATKKA